MEAKKTDGDFILTPEQYGSRAAEIVAARTAWSFYGICAVGTEYPNGSIKKDSGFGGTYSPIEEAKYYSQYIMGLRLSVPVLLLYYACMLQGHAFTDREDSEAVLIARLPSNIKGSDEVVITGQAADLDDRGDHSHYSFIQRMKSEVAQELFKIVKKQPDFFETYYQTAFPGLDSKKEQYTGLYRLLARKLVVLEFPQLKEFIEQRPHQRISDQPREYERPYLGEQESKAFYDQLPQLELRQPIGVGTVADFLPIKIKHQEEWEARRRKF